MSNSQFSVRVTRKSDGEIQFELDGPYGYMDEVDLEETVLGHVGPVGLGQKVGKWRKVMTSVSVVAKEGFRCDSSTDAETIRDIFNHAAASQVTVSFPPELYLQQPVEDVEGVPA